MGLILDAIERRILGVLIEKSLTQPEYYPMTVNAVVGGCNQKSSRDPVMELDEGVVRTTLETLRKRDLVSLVLPAPGARTNRYRHDVEAALGWNRRQQSLMALLLLRGPQTAGELRSRSGRMFDFESLEAVGIALESLSEGTAEMPVVRVLPRDPGRSAVRYAHLLYGEGEVLPVGEASSTGQDVAGRSAEAVPRDSYSSVAAAPVSGGNVQALQEEIAAMQEEIGDLHAELAELRRRIDDLENTVTGS